MVDDGPESGCQGAQPANPPEEAARIIHELAEALTALGNYVAAAAQFSAGAAPVEIDIRKILEKASGQQERAVTTLRQLQRLMRHRKPS